MQRAHKYDAPKKRRLKKMDQYTIENEDEDDGKVDIRDVDFRLSNDSTKIDVSVCYFQLLLIVLSIQQLKHFWIDTEPSKWRNSLQLSGFDNIKADFGKRFVPTSGDFRWVQPFKVSWTAILSHWI